MIFKKKLENLTVEEQSEVKLDVELSKPSDEVRWMKNSIVLQPGGNMEIRVDGAKQALVFKSVTHADRGIYSCETLDDKTQGKLNVESKTKTKITFLSYNIQDLRACIRILEKECPPVMCVRISTNSTISFPFLQ